MNFDYFSRFPSFWPTKNDEMSTLSILLMVEFNLIFFPTLRVLKMPKEQENEEKQRQKLNAPSVRGIIKANACVDFQF